MHTPPPRQPQLPQGRGQTCQSPKIYLMMVAGFSLPTMCREVPGLLGKEQRSHLHADGMVRVASITCFTPVSSEKHSASQGEDLASGSIPEILSCRLYEPQPTRAFSRMGNWCWVTLIHCSVLQSELPMVLSTCGDQKN